MGKAPTLRGAAAVVLGQLGDRSSPSALLAAARNASESRLVREKAVRGLGYMRDPAASADLAALLDREPDQRFSLVLVDALAKIGGPEAIAAVPVVVELVNDPQQELAARRPPGQVLTGFAAETENIEENGRAKLAAKGCDLLVVNQVGPGLAFGTSDNAALVLGSDGSVTQVPRGPKTALADVIWDLVAARLPALG